MLDTFKARLKAKHSGVNLSTKRIDAIAARLHQKFPDLTEEADHDAKLDDYYDGATLTEIAKDDDRLRTLENKPKDPPKPPEPAPPNPPAPPAPGDDTPAWAKALIDQNKALADRLQGLEKDKTQGTIRSKLKENLKTIPQDFYDEWSIPEKEEDVEAFETKVKSKWETFTKEHPVQPLKSGHLPSRSIALPGKVDQKELDSIVDKL